MEGGVIAIKQILNTAHTETIPPYAATDHTCVLFAHSQTDLCKRVFRMHAVTPFVSVGFSAISVLHQTLEQHLFFHTILFQLKSPEPPIYHTVSQCVHIQTSVLHIFSHHLLQCFSCKASNHLQLYNTLSVHGGFFSHFHTISKTSRNFRVGKLYQYYLLSVSRSQQQGHRIWR